MEENEIEKILIKNEDLIKEYKLYCERFDKAQYAFISSILEEKKRHYLNILNTFKDTKPCRATQALIAICAINFTMENLKWKLF